MWVVIHGVAFPDIPASLPCVENGIIIEFDESEYLMIPSEFCAASISTVSYTLKRRRHRQAEAIQYYACVVLSVRSGF